MRERYNEEKEFGRFDYEMELLDTLRRVVRDCDRVIERARSRLEIHHQADDDDFRKSKEEIAVEESEEIQSLEADIRQKITDCQRLGIEGDVYESFSLFEETEKLKLKLTELRAQAAMLAAQNVSLISCFLSMVQRGVYMLEKCLDGAKSRKQAFKSARASCL